MKKKIPFIVCSMVVVMAIVAMLMFVLSGKDDVVSETLNIEGTWKVVVYFNNDTISIIDNEYMIFDADSASDYRDNLLEPFATSKYVIDSSMSMSLPDISKKYTIKKYTENYIRLYESHAMYIELIRYYNADMSPIDFDATAFEGKWNIIYRNTSNVYAGDYMVFDGGTASQYTGGFQEPIATSIYSWQNGNHLLVNGWSKEMVVYPVSEDTVIMVELNTEKGFIWEFKKDD